MKKNLISQLHQLKTIEPDKTWKESTQEFLHTQIFNQQNQKVGTFKFVVIWLRDLVKVSSQPAFTLAAFILILLTSVFFSQPLLTDAKPSDSLYIARIISEKTQLNMTFDKTAREKLAVRFATDHAKDITHALSDPEFNNQDNESKVARLNENFKREINTVKETLNSINKEKATQDDTESDIIFSAEVNKGDEGLEISDTDTVDDNNNLEDQSGVEDKATSTTQVATSTEDSLDIDADTASSSQEVKVETNNKTETVKALEEAERLFNDKQYDEAMNKLNEVDLLLNAQGAVKEEANTNN